jgi:hypothetical protein
MQREGSVDNREVEERRFGAVQALQAVVGCLRDTNPQAIFAVGKGETAVEAMKLQSISNRWADKASDVLLKALELAEAIGDDGLALFQHPAQKP